MLAKEHCKYEVMLAGVATSSLIAWKLCTFAYQILGSQKLKQLYIYLNNQSYVKFAKDCKETIGPCKQR